MPPLKRLDERPERALDVMEKGLEPRSPLLAELPTGLTALPTMFASAEPDAWIAAGALDLEPTITLIVARVMMPAITVSPACAKSFILRMRFAKLKV